MIFKLDTNDMETLEVTVTDAERWDGIAEILDEFSFGVLSLFLKLAEELNCSTEQAKKFKNIIMENIGNEIDFLLETGVLDKNSNDVDEKELTELVDELKFAGFTEEDVSGVLNLVNELGSIESALDYISKLNGTLEIADSPEE